MYTKYHATSCPDCNAVLTEDSAVYIHVSVADQEFDVNSEISSNGELVDPENLVAIGYHAGTYCSNCDGLLEELTFPGVNRFNWNDLFFQIAHFMGSATSIVDASLLANDDVTIRFIDGEYYRVMALTQITSAEDDDVLPEGHWVLEVEKPE